MLMSSVYKFCILYSTTVPLRLFASSKNLNTSSSTLFGLLTRSSYQTKRVGIFLDACFRMYSWFSAIFLAA